MIFSDYTLYEAYIQLETFTSIGDSPHADMNDEQYHDDLWNRLKKWYIDAIETEKLDSKLAELERIPQLTPEQIQTFLSEFNFRKYR